MKEIRLNFEVKRPVLACGADLKGAFAVSKGKKALLFGGFGDLADPDNFTRYESAIRREVRKIKPKLIACDMHPGYFSTRCAEDLQNVAGGAKLFKIQHHEAHVASAIVDHGIRGDVIGVAFDGTGYGMDGAVWGGEFFFGDLKKFIRAAHFKYMPLPGGDAAVREPWRAAVSCLYGSGLPTAGRGSPASFLKGLDAKRLSVVGRMIDKKVNSPLTSSAGRLFDAVGSMVLCRYAVTKEAELPVELERIVSRGWADTYGFDVKKDKGMYIIDTADTIRGVVSDLSKKTEPSIISGKFHNTFARIVADVCALIRKERGIKRVLLTGGVFQNKFLSERASYLLGEGGFSVYRHLRIDTNDNGIPAGQLAVANSRFLCA